MRAVKTLGDLSQATSKHAHAQNARIEDAVRSGRSGKKRGDALKATQNWLAGDWAMSANVSPHTL